MYRSRFIQAIYLRRTNEFGVIDPANPQDILTQVGGPYYVDTLNADFSINKSITSNADTATVTIYNHQFLEGFYAERRAIFDSLQDNYYDVNLYQWDYGTIGLDLDLRQKAQCIFTGSMSNISIGGGESITDAGLTFNLTAGGDAGLRTVTNRKFAKGSTYRNVVQQLLGEFTAYDFIIDDPTNKLNKLLPKARTVHKKTSEALTDICRDLEMTWGFDASRINVASVPADIATARKTIYFVDKVSTFDTLVLPTAANNNGVGPHRLDGGTGKVGRLSYNKSQFSFETITDPTLNIGRIVDVSDYGTMAAPVGFAGEFKGRINRMTINNSRTTCECSYIDDDNLAILEKDKSNSGSLVL